MTHQILSLSRKMRNYPTMPNTDILPSLVMALFLYITRLVLTCLFSVSLLLSAAPPPKAHLPLKQKHSHLVLGFYLNLATLQGWISYTPLLLHLYQKINSLRRETRLCEWIISPLSKSLGQCSFVFFPCNGLIIPGIHLNKFPWI